MAYLKNFLLPPTGEQIDSARLVAWAVQPGQSFVHGQTLLEIETDKSVIEIPAEEDGTMVKHLVDVDGTLNADTAVAQIEVAGEALDDMEADADPTATAAHAPPADMPPAHDTASVKPLDTALPAAAGAVWSQGNMAPGARTFATPSARRLARERGVALDALAGTGPGGRITQGDVATAQVQRQAGGQEASFPAATPGGARHAHAAPRQEAYSVNTVHGELFAGRWTPAAERDTATVVLIHGMFGDMDTWASAISALTRAGLSVLAMDLPCHGGSRADVSSIDDIVEAVADLVSRETMGPLALVGHSFGAAVSVRLAGKLGMRVQALALIAPMGLGTDIEQTFLDGMTHAVTDEALARELRKLTESGAGVSATYLRDLGKRLRNRTTALQRLCAGLSCNGVQQIDTTADLQALTCRTMIVHGRRDMIIPWQHALNAPPRTALHLLPGVGHMPQWEAATLTAELILDLVVR